MPPLTLYAQISYTATSELLSDRELFPSVWRMYPSVLALYSPVIAILRQYTWTKLKIITQDESLFREVSLL